ncbi:Ig-like domain-containing protein [Paenibacillus ihumii]|uniref:Ig-like domain-containing protein n=1 Tax=Paenibacillus ihumii TaxID=687436 RepID=UPI0006D7E2CB|nr:Ig-like domain-containing protein [Paenibacillus ihumii]
MIPNRKMTKWLLTMVLLIAAVFPTSVFAASGDVLSIDIEGSGATLELTVGKGTKQLKVWATVEGSSVKKDITRAVSWSSDQPDTIKVDNGLLTPLKSGTATITAVYNDSAVDTITVKAVDTYKDLTLEYSLKGKYKLGADEADLNVKAQAIIENTNGQLADVTQDAHWTSSNTSVLTIDKGKIKLVGEGKATITAKYSGLTASFEATVSSPYSELNLIYANGERAEDIELVVGDKEIEIKATSIVASDKSTSDVTDKAEWSTSDKAVATVEDGKIKAVAVGKATITAEYLGAKGQVDVYVRTPYEVIMLNPSSDQALFIGERLEAKAEVRSRANFTDEVTAEAEWTSSNPLAVTVERGVISPKAVGSSTIKVSHLGVSKTIKVTVQPTITKLEADKTELELFKNESLNVPKIKATKLDDEEIDFSKEVNWTSSNEDIVKIEDGKIVAKDAGTVTITAKLPESKVTAESAYSIRSSTVDVQVTVKEKVLALISEEEKLNLVVGEESPFPKVAVVWENGNEEADLSSEMTWTISNSNAVIKDSADGKTIKGLIKGSATLKGTYSNKTISIPITVEQKITKIVVEPLDIELNLKKSKSIKVTGYYSNGQKVTLSTKMNWQSSNTGVATISTSSVKAVGEGSATLTGSYQGHNATVNVKVVPKLTKLTVDEKKFTLAPGASKSVVVKAQYDTGLISDVTGSAVWTSSKPSVAKVTAGKIEAVGKGTTSIKGKFGGKTVTISVTVK